MTRARKDPAIYRSLYCVKERLLMRILPSGRKSLRELTALKDAFTGRRCFIIGNGPSLRQTNMSQLRDELTFGLYRIYLLFPQMGFRTTFLVAINRLVLEQVGQELLDFPGPLFVPWSSRKYLAHPLPENLRFMLTGCSSASFSRGLQSWRRI